MKYYPVYNELRPRNSENFTCVTRKPFSRFPTKFDTNQAAQKQRIEISDSESIGLYYLVLCSEIKGDNQLRGDSVADLRLCFRICKKKKKKKKKEEKKKQLTTRLILKIGKLVVFQT